MGPLPPVPRLGPTLAFTLGGGPGLAGREDNNPAQRFIAQMKTRHTPEVRKALDPRFAMIHTPEVRKALDPRFAMIWIRTPTCPMWIALHGMCRSTFHHTPKLKLWLDAMRLDAKPDTPTTEEFVADVEACAASYRDTIEKNITPCDGRAPVITIIYSDDPPLDGIGAAPS
jgi:hypothetical protein